MKHLKLLAALGLLLTSISAFADNRESGIDRGNGGDEYAKAFIELGTDIAESLAQHPLPGVSAEALIAAIRSTQVNSRDRLVLRGDEVDAINDSSLSPPQILVSRAGWDRMASAPHRRAFLVLHEYLGVLGIDDSRYQISRMLDRANVCERSPAVRNSIESSLKKSCFRVISDDLKYISSLGGKENEKSVLRLEKSDFAGLPRLEGLYFYNYADFILKEGMFDLAPALRVFAVADTFNELTDCSFFAKLPQLEQLTLTYASYMEERKFLRAIAPGCFAKLKKLSNISIGIEGSGTGFEHMFEGLQDSKALRSVSIYGRDLSRLGTRLFTHLPAQLAYVSVTNVNGRLDPSVMKYLNDRFGTRLWCSQTDSLANPEGGMSQVHCNLKQ